MSNIPSVVDGPRLEVKKKIEYDIPCPKCSKEMRVTNVSDGSLIECKSCGNVTWRMSYIAPWWAKTSKFIISLALSFVLGVASSFAASIIYEKYYKPANASAYSNPATATAKSR